MQLYAFVGRIDVGHYVGNGVYLHGFKLLVGFVG